MSGRTAKRLRKVFGACEDASLAWTEATGRARGRAGQVIDAYRREVVDVRRINRIAAELQAPPLAFPAPPATRVARRLGRG